MDVNAPYRPPPLESPLIRYRDRQLLVVEKPGGLLTVPGRGPDKQDCLLQRVQREIPEVLVVHRLDMETSGLVLFARDRATQGRLGRLFQRRRVFKRYVAWVRGVPEQVAGEVELPLILDWPNRPLQKVDFLRGRGVRVLNVAGPRASGSPSIYGRVRVVLLGLLALLETETRRGKMPQEKDR